MSRVSLGAIDITQICTRKSHGWKREKEENSMQDLCKRLGGLLNKQAKKFAKPSFLLGDSWTGSRDYLELGEEVNQEQMDLNSKCFKKKKQTDKNFLTNRNKDNEKRPIKKFFTSKNFNKRRIKKNSGIEPTLTKKLSSSKRKQERRYKSCRNTVDYVSQVTGFKKSSVQNENSRMMVNKNSSKIIDKNLKCKSSGKRTASKNKKGSRKSIQKIVPKELQNSHSRVNSNSLKFNGNLVELLKNYKGMKNKAGAKEAGQSKNKFLVIGSLKTRITTKGSLNSKTAKMVKNERRSKSIKRQSMKRKTKESVKHQKTNSVAADKRKSSQRSRKPRNKHLKTLSINLLPTHSRLDDIENHFLIKKQLMTQFANEKGRQSKANPSFKINVNQFLNMNKGYTTQRSSKMKSIDYKAFKTKQSAEKKRKLPKSIKKEKSAKKNLLTNYLDSNMYIESLRAKLSEGDVRNTKNINFRKKLKTKYLIKKAKKSNF